jgi:small GTP-binding protein
MNLNEKEGISQYIYKIVICGYSGIGKTTMINKFCNNKWNDECTSTICMEFYTISKEIRGKYIKYHIWDLSGHEKFRTNTDIKKQYNANCIIITYQANDENSLIKLHEIFNETIINNKIIIIACTKYDLLDSLEKQNNEIKKQTKLKERYNCKIFNISGKFNYGIEEMFNYIGNALLNEFPEQYKLFDKIIYPPNLNDKKYKKINCVIT